MENLEINKGLDWTATQWVAAAAGFFASAGMAQLLVWQGYATRNWAIILVIIGFGAPPFIVGWLDVRKHKRSKGS